MGYITLQGILQMLHVVKGPSGSGEYLARCPAHDDRQASLCVKEGDKGILLKCQAGCSAEMICSRIGVEMKDLFKESGKPAARKKTTPAKAQDKPPIKITDVKTYKSFDEAFGHIGKIEATYNYTDEQGKLRFTVCRIMPPDGKKTFRQCRPADMSVNGFPIVAGVPMGVRSGIIYQLPAVKRAIEGDKPVFVVEGEKDVHTMVTMGYTATTSPMGADHWDAKHGEQLKYADVVIIPDNDAPGEKYAKAVTDTVMGLARRVRVIHLSDAVPELSEHGDVTDLANMVGMARTKEIIEMLVQNAEALREDPYQEACRVFKSINSYDVEDGCIRKIGEKGTRTLSTFTALPVYEVTKDDGVTSSKLLEIDGWTVGGKPLPRISVPIKAFQAMGWPMENWGLAANIMPGNAVRDQLRSVIAEAGAKVAKRRTIYTHTGWREVGGKWAYLYQGGCIGAKDVSVDMGTGLEHYTLDTECGMKLVDAIDIVNRIGSVIRPGVAVPLLGVVFLAPLREFLLKAKCPPAFITFIKGASSTQKSTAASLFLSFFGDFHNKSMPANFGDTANYIRTKAFLLKDTLLVIDDYHPQTSIQERRKMEATAQSLSRAFGDLAERGRMSADLSLQASKPPRCIALMTGEQLPDIGPSGVNRFYTIDVAQGDIPRGDALTELQQQARDGVFRRVMRKYIEWLLPQAGKLPGMLGRGFTEYRSRATRLMAGKGVHGRTVEAIAHIMVGLTFMMYYFEDAGYVDHNTAQAVIEDYWTIVAQNSDDQIEASREDSPTSLFMRAISEMLTSKVLRVVGLGDGLDPKVPEKGMAGYADGEYYYLMGDTVLGAVVRFYKDQDRVFPLQRAALYKMLREEKIIDVGKDNKPTRVKRLPSGKTERFLWVPRWRLDGGDDPNAKIEQEKMQFKVMDESDIPEELR